MAIGTKVQVGVEREEHRLHLVWAGGAGEGLAISSVVAISSVAHHRQVCVSAGSIGRTGAIRSRACVVRGRQVLEMHDREKPKQIH
jgi:hypothetical protein